MRTNASRIRVAVRKAAVVAVALGAIALAKTASANTATQVWLFGPSGAYLTCDTIAGGHVIDPYGIDTGLVVDANGNVLSGQTTVGFATDGV